MTKFIISSTLLLAATVSAAGADLLNLSIGDPARREKKVEARVDEIADSLTGEVISPEELARRLSSVRILLVGESHTSMEFHRVQKRLLQALAETGREVLIGLEMFPYTEQEHLDHWSDGFLTEEGFLDLAEWYKNWGYNWGYYREIFLMARQGGIRMYAVNSPREVVTAVRKKGFDNLTEEEKAHVPDQIDTASEEHLQLFKAFFSEDDQVHSSMSDEQWKGMFEAQCTWDATMGFNAVSALKKARTNDAIMVILVGSGHVAYGMGIQRQVSKWFDGPVASVIPVTIEADKSSETIQASYSDYVWGVPDEGFPVFPETGLSTSKDAETGKPKVVFVGPHSAAAEAGVKTGDLLVSIDGHSVAERSVFNRVIASKNWGDNARLVVLREDVEQEVVLKFRRRFPEKEAAADSSPGAK